MRGPCIMKGAPASATELTDLRRLSQEVRRKVETAADLRRPKETDETLVERSEGKGPWLRTGDVAYVKDDAFYICDRIKELIKVRSRRCFRADLAVQRLPGSCSAT